LANRHSRRRSFPHFETSDDPGSSTLERSVERIFTAPEQQPILLRARSWFEDLSAQLGSRFGENWLQVGAAWALTWDTGLEPIAGAMRVRRAATNAPAGDEASARLDEQIRRLLAGDMAPAAAAGAFFHDLVDALLGRGVRRWMGDSPAGGAPVPIDSWAFRSAGYVDGALVGLLRAKGVDEVELAGLEIDFEDEPTEDQYECAAEFFHEVAEHLNRIDWMQLSWEPHQAMSVGRTAEQIGLGVSPTWPEDILHELSGGYG